MASADARIATVTSREGDFPMRLSVPAQSFKKTFASTAGVRAFLEQEEKFWNELSSRSQGAVFNHLSQHLLPLAGAREATAAASLARKGEDPGNSLRALERLVSAPPILSGGKQGTLIASIAEAAPTVVPMVAIALAAELRPELVESIPSNRITGLDLGTALLSARLLDHSRHGAAEKARLDGLLADTMLLHQQLTDAQSEFLAWRTEQREQWSTDLEAFKENLAGTINSATNALASHQEMATERLSQTLASADSDLGTFKKKVRQDVVGEVPTTFWNKKADEHRIIAMGAGLCFLAVAVIGVVILATQGVALVSAAFRSITGTGNDSAVLALVPLAFITIPSLAFAWILRHISRVMIQNLSLEADARLRGTITSTFRALAADRAMSEAELAIALQALFRPIDGKDHAEITPPNLADILKFSEKTIAWANEPLRGFAR